MGIGKITKIPYKNKGGSDKLMLMFTNRYLGICCTPMYKLYLDPLENEHQRNYEIEIEKTLWIRPAVG